MKWYEAALILAVVFLEDVRESFFLLLNSLDEASLIALFVVVVYFSRNSLTHLSDSISKPLGRLG
ncbi:MAG: hypothetical protein ABH803_02560 [Candidatus Micrarchaeota archaeon]